MRLTLVLDFSGMTYYGNIPNTPFPPDPRVDETHFDIGEDIMSDEWDLLDAEFVLPLDKLCDLTLDYGDVDYLDAEKCANAETWLRKRLAEGVPEQLAPVFGKLSEYATRAKELKTGVVVEL